MEGKGFFMFHPNRGEAGMINLTIQRGSQELEVKSSRVVNSSKPVKAL